MREVQDILDQNPIGGQGREEEGDRPTPPHVCLPQCPSPGEERDGEPPSGARCQQALTSFQPPALKELDDLTGVHPRHARCCWMNQRALDLLMLQELIASASRNALHPCQLELRDEGRLAILAVQARPVPSLLGKQSASNRS
jgi:hypothetical protein